MPTIQNNNLYTLIYRHASERFARGVEGYEIRRAAGEPLYRYVSYRNNMPQPENAGRTIFPTLQQDTANRWTGMGADGAGHQGLYLSGEFINQGHPFPELEHYQAPGQQPDAQITYFDYHPGDGGIDPTPATADAGQLRSMFLFTLDNEARGLDLNLMRGGEINPLLKEIYDAAKADRPDLFGEDDTLEALYNHPDDASFCRAIGNACLESTDKDYFETTSVRDNLSSNVIMRGPARDPLRPPAPLVNLDAQGRATFFVEGDTVGKGVYSVSDMLYNTRFEDPGVRIGPLPSTGEFSEMLYTVAKHSIDQLSDQYETMLENNPPTDVMESVAENIVNLRGHIDARNLQGCLDGIDTLHAQLQEVQHNYAAGLEADQLTAIKVVDGVTNALSDMTRAIEAARDRIDAPGQEHPEDVPDIADPAEDEINPIIGEN